MSTPSTPAEFERFSAGPWPATPQQAIALQNQLRPLARVEDPGPDQVYTVAGIDVAYRTDDDVIAAAAVVLDAETLAPLETATAHGRAAFPYQPGLLAFRELPAIAAALEKLTIPPDLLICDGSGLAHPRRFGLACHLGVLLDLPTIGVAKTPVGPYRMPDPPRGSWTEIRDDDGVVGRALRTRENVKPVFVSVGHRTNLTTACAHVLRLCRHRLPETTRRADHLARHALANSPSGESVPPTTRAQP
ncbi:endonuclease V [Pseudonocardia eucalypti]|uniref:Endonuclease V n=1 Tax=Pseudonocardia eucalypti TaxID=648755 RepID=A0ABP9R9U1_9PSEU|nr:deoxyribonuclease V [Pseudonocardia eucalypti]